MRLLSVVFLFGFACLGARAEDWTIHGKVYHNVVVQNVTADHVDITFDGGVGSPRLADLPADLQTRFNYEPPNGQAEADARAAVQKAAGVILTVKIGETDLKLAQPAGMVDLPKDDPEFKAIADLTSPECVLLRTCVSSEALDPTKEPGPDQDILVSRTLALKEVPMDIDYGHFIDLVRQTAAKATHGILLSQDSPVDFVESEKRLDQFEKDTGIEVKDDSDVYSLGMVSRSDGCVSFMTAEYVTTTFQGKTERRKCVSVVAYLLIKKKILITETSLNKVTVLHEDLRTLQRAADQYQIELQTLNN